MLDFNYTFYNEKKVIHVKERINYNKLFLFSSTIDGNKVYTSSEGIKRLKAFLSKKACYKYNNFYRVKTGSYYYAITLDQETFTIKCLGVKE